MPHFSDSHLKKLKSFYNQKNKFGIYSHSTDRFIIVNEISFFETLSLSKILSSKITVQPTIIEWTLPIDSNNCLEYSLFNKTITSTKTPIASYPIKQIEIPLFIKNETELYRNIIEIDPEIKKLQSYAIFCLKVIYAIEIANSLRNNFLTGEILESTGMSDLVDYLSIKHDYSESDIGIKKEILKTLYLSDNEQQAENRIKEIWINLGRNLIGYRQYFYYYLDRSEPYEFESIKYDKNSFTRRAC